MQGKDFTTTIVVDQTPEEVFNAIKNVAAWWTGEPGVKGRAFNESDEFIYQFRNIHYSKQRVTELVPFSKIVWLIEESELSFVSNRDEWTGTKIIFEIFEKAPKTEVRFTHSGLVQELECYADCSKAWSSYISESLMRFISEPKVTTAW